MAKIELDEPSVAEGTVRKLWRACRNKTAEIQYDITSYWIAWALLRGIVKETPAYGKMTVKQFLDLSKEPDAFDS